MKQFETLRSFSFTVLLSGFLTVAATPGAWSQNAPATPPAPQVSEVATPTQLSQSGLAIGGGDLKKISVFGAPESDQEVRVDQAGNVSLSFIGSVHVAGLTNNQAQDLIAKKLVAGGFFAQPQVSV